jgi:transcriptional regulator with GAF, ATPase, and Fis domain
MGANVATAVQRALAELRLLNPLVEHFRGEVNRGDGLGLDIRGVTREAMAILEGDDWPGNVRELEAVVKRAMVCRREGSGRGVGTCRLRGLRKVLVRRQISRNPCLNWTIKASALAIGSSAPRNALAMSPRSLPQRLASSSSARI